MQPRHITLKYQSGAALALSLMMMAILTTIGVVAMNTTLLELMMAGNLQFQTVALVNAENTLVTAETAAATFSAGDTGTGMRDLATDIANDTEVDPLTVNWDGSTPFAIDADNHYLLEYAGIQIPEGNSAKIGSGGSDPIAEVIRVTAQSESTNGTERIVRSYFVNLSNK